MRYRVYNLQNAKLIPVFTGSSQFQQAKVVFYRKDKQHSPDIRRIIKTWKESHIADSFNINDPLHFLSNFKADQNGVVKIIADANVYDVFFQHYRDFFSIKKTDDKYVSRLKQEGKNRIYNTRLHQKQKYELRIVRNSVLKRQVFTTEVTGVKFRTINIQA